MLHSTPTLSVVAVLLLYYVVVVFLLTYWGVSKLEKNVKICSEQNVNLFGNFSKFVRGVSKLASFCQISINCSIIITIAIMGRSKHTSSQNYAAMGRNLAYCWRGNKKPEECRGWSQSDEKISMWGVDKAYEWHEREDWCGCRNNWTKPQIVD